MTDTQALRVAELPQNTPTLFELAPDAPARALLAQELGLIALRKLRFSGEISAYGKHDWQLKGKLGATVVQPCVVTLEPVTTRIDTEIHRLFLTELPEDEAPDVEMPEDDNSEKLGAWIDPAAVMAEALALALPLYPRKQDVELGEAIFTEPGKAPMRDKDTRPFAGLSGLRDALKQGK
ncbi:YceD family protein [Antarcticimicrobium sediminis]|uniref:DUF177 domain-containing protein n=1 Tax=Antarcticimicrobium sediminis TaxID=2546227 RepID=A0A4R5EZA8_9RHOB|nr:DUF177 domain-containing protein [Antarcticimicrobium sediminis]TDE40401.1 DUF177 domain-containing protein [Antarcticimicrobium sediminis]